MNDTDDRALALVVDEATIPPGDEALAKAADAVRMDLARIRRGLALLAEEAPAPPAARRRPRARFLLAGAAAVALAAATIGLVVANREGDERLTASGGPETTMADPGGAVRPAARPEPTLEERVAEAEYIVVGRVTRVDAGVLAEAGGLEYVLATVAVEESLKPMGIGGGTVVAFDYSVDAMTSGGASAPWMVGDRVMLFLVSDAGTVSEDLTPAHLQVAGGNGGRFLFAGDDLVAPFSIEQVREALAAD